MSHATAVPVTASADTGLNTIYGWNFAENAGVPAAARVLLRDGSAAGAIIADIRLAASDSKDRDFSTPLALAAGDLYAEVSVGTVRGAVYGR